MRPKDYDKIVFLEKKIKEYFDECDSVNMSGVGASDKKIRKPYTLSGLLCELGMTRGEFEKLGTRPNFAKLYMSALSKIEAFTEEHALTGALSATAAANSLKYNFGWGDTRRADADETEKSIKIILDGDLIRLAE